MCAQGAVVWHASSEQATKSSAVLNRQSLLIFIEFAFGVGALNQFFLPCPKKAVLQLVILLLYLFPASLKLFDLCYGPCTIILDLIHFGIEFYDV